MDSSSNFVSDSRKRSRNDIDINEDASFEPKLKKQNKVSTVNSLNLQYQMTFNTHIPSYIQLDVCSYQLSGHWLQWFLKNPVFPIEKPVTKFDLAVK